MDITLDELVKIAGTALEAEDRYILGCSAAIGKCGGILRFVNEHYYQFIAIRGWCSRFDVSSERAFTQEFRHDAIISEDGVRHTVVEMKCWVSSAGYKELPKIRSDLKKLSSAKSNAAFIVIFSANKRGQTQEQLNSLIKEIPKLGTEYKLYSFPTLSPESFGPENRESDFWVAGWPVARGV